MKYSCSGVGKESKEHWSCPECPKCGAPTEVIDSRPTVVGTRRRRRCLEDHRFTTYEIYGDRFKARDLFDDRLATVRKAFWNLMGPPPDLLFEPIPAENAEPATPEPIDESWGDE